MTEDSASSVKMTQKSTISYYKKRRRALLNKILSRNGYRLGEVGIRFCEKCYRFEFQVEELHIHHPENNGLVPDGGWQALYTHESDFEDNVEQKILCKKCHGEIHDTDVFGEVKI